MQQTMNLAERIYEEAQRLPEPLKREVLNFIEYLEFKHGIADRGIENLKMAQQPVMDRIWDKPDDDAWSDLSVRADCRNPVSVRGFRNPQVPPRSEAEFSARRERTFRPE